AAPPSRSRAPMIVAGLLAAGALGAVLWFGRASPAPVPESTPIAVEAPAPSPEPVAPAPPPAVQEVTLTITSEPPGAQVSIADQPAGVTPLEWTTPRSETAVAVKL